MGEGTTGTNPTLSANPQVAAIKALTAKKSRTDDLAKFSTLMGKLCPPREAFWFN
jgi:hypothetical protein